MMTAEQLNPDPLWQERIEDQPQTAEQERHNDELIRARCIAVLKKRGHPVDDSGKISLA